MLAALKDAYRTEYGAYEEIATENLDEAAIEPYVRKQASPEWRLGQTPRFDLEIENRFPWGNMQLLLTLRHGRVAALDVYTDANDADLADEVKRRLLNVPYGEEPLSAALADSERAELQDLARFIREQAL